MNVEEILSQINLPKWPQLMIVGNDVTVDQAKEIIFRTDDALYSPEYKGNNKSFERSMLRLLGHEFLTQIGLGNTYFLKSETQRKMDLVGLDYVVSNYAYSAFIGGPYGFCSPEGKIYFEDNVGKWPSAFDIYKDLVNLASSFPYLEFKSSLYNGESCEEGSQCVVSFLVSGGEVNVKPGVDFNLRDHMSSESKTNIFLARLSNPKSTELGLNEHWYFEFAQRYRQAMYSAILSHDFSEVEGAFFAEEIAQKFDEYCCEHFGVSVSV